MSRTLLHKLSLIVAQFVLISGLKPHKIYALEKDFFIKCDVFFRQYVNNGLVDYPSLKQNPTDLFSLCKEIETAEPAILSDVQGKAFYINAYNLLVINSIVNYYPVKSVLDIEGMFDKEKHKIAKKELTLNQLEKEVIFANFNDARLHFALVCGAVGCPVLRNAAFMPENLEQDLDLKVKTDLDNPHFIRQEKGNKKIFLSKIFQWYEKDFGKVVDFINKYKSEKIATDSYIDYYEYDWKLNEKKYKLPTNQQDGETYTPYKPSSLLALREVELKIFSNLYSQLVNTYRSNYFTTYIQTLYGARPNLAVGFDLKFRTVNNGNENKVGLFDVYQSAAETVSRLGLTAVALKAKFVPFSIPNVSFSAQTALVLPIGKTLEGDQSLAYLDNSGVGFYANIYFDKNFANKFSWFLSVSSLIDNITSSFDKTYWQMPIDGIINYYPSSSTNIYWLGELSFNTQNINYAQTGIGVKYAVMRFVELELLYTFFTNRYVQEHNGFAQTINLGLRYSIK